MRRVSTIVAGSALLAGLALGPAEAHAGHVERLDTTRPEAWAMRYFAAALVDSGTGETGELPAGGLEIGFEAAWLPSLSARQRAVGFDGEKTEDLNRTPLIGRPVVKVGLPAGFVATAGWIPPLELDGATANVLTLAIGRSFPAGERSRIELRLAAAHATIRGDLTCPADAAAAGDDPVRNPYGCDEPSSDEQRSTTLGLEGAYALRLGAGERRPELRLAAGAHHFDGTFHVDARYFGFHDQAHLTNRSWLGTFSAGLAVPASDRTRVAFEVLYSPLSVDRRTGDGFARRREQDGLLHARALLTFRLR